MRRKQHPVLARLGPIVQANSAQLILAAAVCLMGLCVAIKSAQFDAELSNWIQRSGRIQTELNFVDTHLGEGAGSSGELILQTPLEPQANALRPEALVVHLEALATATQVTVDLFEISWSFKDLCFTPTIPDFDFEASMILNRMMPCTIKSPIDCFWEGSKLLGPDEPVETLVNMGLSNSKWTSLNPLPFVEMMKRGQPNAGFPYDSLIDWMRRVGMTTGYQLKPCLDPTDRNCPDSAPNKLNRQPPDVGLELTGGCRGFASNQMHWKEEEIVGGAVHNKSGHLVHASGLQSTIQLMGDQDLYEYWRQTDKVNRLNGWSVEKAKMVLELWQRRFKEELKQFTRTSEAASAYKIHAMTSKSMLEPIEVDSLWNLANIVLCFSIMTLLACALMPDFSQFQAPSYSNQQTYTGNIISRLTNRITKLLLRVSMALISSLFVGLTLMASLGLSCFLNLPLNMATTWILPPIALYYGFSQFITISNIYSQKLLLSEENSNSSLHITTECLIESFPVVIIECLSYVVALSASTIIPVPATRVFAIQAIIFIMLSSSISFLLIPSILNTFLKLMMKTENSVISSKPLKSCEFSNSISTLSNSPKPKITRTPSPITKFAIRNKRTSANQADSNDSNIEEQILSRIQDDLRNIQADSCSQPTNISFSAHLGADGLQTKFSLTTSQSRSLVSTSNNSSKNDSNLNLCNRNVDFSHKKFQRDSVSSDIAIQLPDLVADALSRPANPSPSNAKNSIHETDLTTETHKRSVKLEVPNTKDADQIDPKSIEKFAGSYAKLIQLSICFIALFLLVASMFQITNVKYGLQLKDIISRETPEYEAFLIQENNFPVYNVHAITKGNFDYPNNQRLLYQFYEALKRMDGILLDDDDSTTPKFWLIAFRDWLLMLQQKFDQARNKSLISTDGWTSETSESAKLAYKLLAQTGRVDNLVDKNQVMTNRLVDSNGIINPKAFYYYLTAWVVKDPFTYATSEANFRPEPNIWDHHRQDNLKIERARPLVYTQIPFQMKLPANHESLEKILAVRTVSQAFEQFNLPNFPTGIPFVFWDQFTNLDVYLSSSLLVGITFVFILVKLITSDVKIAAITTIPTTLTLLELYGFLGYSSIPFNNILAVLLINSIGLTTLQTVHFTTVSKIREVIIHTAVVSYN